MGLYSLLEKSIHRWLKYWLKDSEPTFVDLRMASYSWRLSFCVAAASLGIAVAANTVKVVVDAAANLEQGGKAMERNSFESLATVSKVQREALECPVSDRVAVGTKCSCGGKDCEEASFCFALESDEPTCQKLPRQDPSILDIYGVTKNGPADGKDNGAINGRVLKFYKKSASSGLRLFYSDNLRTTNSRNSGWASANRWEIKIDGSKCPSGPIQQDFYQNGRSNPHRMSSFGGYCTGVGKGDHTVTVTVAPRITSAGYHDAYTGWGGWGKQAAWHLEVQEIPEDYPLYHQKSGKPGADGRDSGVLVGRVLSFKKQNKDNRLRLFYSDNMGSYTWNHARSCRWEIRVDGSTCGSGRIAGDVYAYIKHEQVYRPRSFMGYCEDVAAGDHKADVLVGSTPGWSCDAHTGWYSDEHVLLEAEEIPKATDYPMVHYKMNHQADSRSSGEVNNYKVTFTKQHEETRLRLFFTESLRAYTSTTGSCACKWELLVDGKHCPNAEIFGQVYVWRNAGHHRDTNPLRVRTFAGFCENIGKGSHAVTVNVKRSDHHCYCNTGWSNSPSGNGAHGVLEVHEIFKPCTSFSKDSCEGRCYWNEKLDRCWDAPPCPGHDKIAVGTACRCGEKKELAEQGKFCYEDGTVTDSAKKDPEKSFASHPGAFLRVISLAVLVPVSMRW